MTKQEALHNISNLSALVVGDVMMDAYLFGKVERDSPEAPVPVVLMTGRDERAGGAANVARNVQALGADVHLATVIGNDPAGIRLIELFKARGMGIEGCILSKGRPTTVKTRIIRDEAHMLRVDEETDEEISTELSASLLSSCISILDNKRIDVLIFEDYDKGVLTQTLISGLIGEAKKRKIPVAVDPKLKGFLNYRGVDLFKPNLKELREGLEQEVDIPEGLPSAIGSLHEKIHPIVSLTTLGNFGMWVHAPSEGVVNTHFPCRPSKVIDVSGAGDTVIATAALMLASGASPSQIAETANIAGGLVCEQSGVVTVDLKTLLSEI
ncbi:MAG: bifunctional ADP-heptose synthase [Flavobacteriales bacterium]|nr:bifunctional ADP-heptose synthase [Flavobacteriales bacterium]